MRGLPGKIGSPGVPGERGMQGMQGKQGEMGLQGEQKKSRLNHVKKRIFIRRVDHHLKNLFHIHFELLS